MIIREIHDFSLSHIAESGQCFRMNRLGSGAYSVIAWGKYLEISDLGQDRFQFSCSEEEYNNIWNDYFDLSADYSIPQALIPPEDSFLRAAVSYGRGMRILNQDPWEVTVSFIISQRKNIPAIKKAIETLCRTFGSKIHASEKPYFCFPDARHISELACSEIGCCSLGYRDKYVISAARRVALGDIDYAKLREADEYSAKASLMSLYGVGEKVANCILLFGLHHTNAFPQDIWIKRIIDTEYDGVFPIHLYNGYLGIIQQYIFYYARSKEYKFAAPLLRHYS